MGLLSACMLGAALPAHSQQRPEADWTVMVFMNGDNNLEDDAMRDFAEMAAVGSTDRVNVVVQFDRRDLRLKDKPGIEKDEARWTRTLRFRVEKGMRPRYSKGIDIGEADMGDGATLAAFVDWARTTYPARHTMLEIWDHGQGWRFMEMVALAGSPELRKSVARSRSEQFADTHLPETRALTEVKGEPELRFETSPYRAVSHDEQSGHMMYNRVIQDALEGLKDNKGHVDVISFDACLMGMVETAYAFRNVSKCMVGSEDLVPGEGWDYTRVLSGLTKAPNSTPEELSRLIVKAFQDSNEESARNYYVTMSAVALDRIPALATSISALGDSLAASLDSQRGGIVEARKGCSDYAAWYGPQYDQYSIDLGLLCSLLKTGNTDPAVVERITAVENALGASVLANFASEASKKDYGSNGIAIYFPHTGDEFKEDGNHGGYLDTNKIAQVQFVADHRWDNFLLSFYGMNAP
jgi:hypothetical protein